MKNEVGRSMTLDRVEASLSALGCSGMDDYTISMFSHCLAKFSQCVYFSHFPFDSLLKTFACTDLKKIIEQAQIDEVSPSLSFI